MSGAVGRRAILLAILVGLTLTACLADAPVPTAAPTASPAPEATPTVTSYVLDTTVWYGGFVLRFGTATATLDPKGGPVTVELDLSNPGPDDAALDGPIVLTSAGRSLEPTRESVLPLVPAGGTGLTTLAFDADATFDVGEAAIEVGRRTEHQAILPLGETAAGAVTLEPLTLDLSVDGLAGTLLIELRGADLRADLPDWRQELGRDRLALTVTYDATFRSDFIGGLPFTADSVALRLPDGSTVGPRRDGHSQSILVLDPRTRAVDLQSRFEVPVPGGGDYAFVVTDGSKTTELPFRIELP